MVASVASPSISRLQSTQRIIFSPTRIDHLARNRFSVGSYNASRACAVRSVQVFESLAMAVLVPVTTAIIASVGLRTLAGLIATKTHRQIAAELARMFAVAARAMKRCNAVTVI